MDGNPKTHCQWHMHIIFNRDGLVKRASGISVATEALDAASQAFENITFNEAKRTTGDLHPVSAAVTLFDFHTEATE